MTKPVRVEISPEGLPVRIFRDKSWKTCSNTVQIMDRNKAVSSIRDQVFERAWNETKAEARKLGLEHEDYIQLPEVQAE